MKQEWQPIETAPKDGTWILVWMPDRGVMVVSWGEHYRNDNEYGWMDYLDSFFELDEATHWMPSPEPPSD